ncbi:MAG: CapA family protein [Gammaproteobacteria bacterium]|nr:CapA family protein [Gammaproteobacteria bacterium]
MMSASNCRITLIGLVVIFFAGCASVKIEPVESATPSIDISIQPRQASIVAVGDIMLGGKAQARLDKEGYDFPFAETREVLQSADIAIGNLETSLTHAGQPFADKKYLFRNSPDKVAAALKQAGFDIVTLANNHSMDYGAEGLLDTLTALDKAGIRSHGAGENIAEARKAQVFKLENGLSLAFLAYSNTFPEEFWATRNNAGTAYGHEQYVREDVGKLVGQGIDIIVVSFHWGRERETELRSYQALLAHAAIDAGADLVIGHHPHILQAVEKYKSGIILYSLGNYTFSTFSPHVYTSVVAKVNFVDGLFADLVMIPININNFDVQLQPKILDGQDAERVYDEINELSRQRGTELLLLENVITTRPNAVIQ